jgi:outer membrane protein assembly factor BamB
VIDLDLPAPPAAEPPARVRSRRRVLSVVVVLAVALLVPAAAVAQTAVLVPTRTVWVAGTSSGFPLGDTLYIAQQQPDRRVTAYPLAGGPSRWSTVVPQLQGFVQFADLGEVIVATAYNEGAQRPYTVALDRRTGAVRWDAAADLLARDPARGRVLLGDFPLPRDAGDSPPGEVVAVTAGTGERVWVYHRDGGCLIDLPDPVGNATAGLAVLCDRELSVVDLGIGRVRATTQVPATSLVPGSIFGRGLAALDDRLLVSAPASGHSVLTAFGYPDLRLQWRTELDLGNYGIAECGRLLCLFSSPFALALDRADGRVAWRLRAGGSVESVDDRYVAIEQAAQGTIQLVDTAGGATVLRLTGWIPARYEVGAPIFYRSEALARRLYLAVLDSGRALRLLDVVPEPDGDVVGCVTADRYLVCRTVKDAIQVWRIASG